MLSWLKDILGENYTEDAERKISQEIGKSFVAKADFNAKNDAVKALEEQVRERDAQLETLKKSTGDADALKEQIASLQAQNVEVKTAYEAELARVRLDGAVEAALTAAGAKNNIAAKALLADFLKDAKTDESGSVKGLSEELDRLAKSDATAFLFESKNKSEPIFKGMQPGAAGGKMPPPQGKEPKDMNYDELCAYLDGNPSAKLE